MKGSQAGSGKKIRRHFCKALVLAVCVCMGVGISCISGCSGQNVVKQETAAEIATHEDLSTEAKVDKILAQMSTAEKVGQMVMIGVHGTSINDDMAYMLSEYDIGGVILFDRNLETQNQVIELNRQLQAHAHGILPLFIAIDEEGGRVSRMKDVLTPPPSQQAIGVTDEPEQARLWAVKTANELKKYGFNVNFAPVADVGSDSAQRMYSNYPDKVTRFVSAAVKGYESEKMLCSLKHFPGIGRGETDSHNGFVNVSASADAMENLEPFRFMIANADQDNFWVMVTHVTYSAFDDKNPASFSSAIMTDLLRNKLKYQGIVITDDLDMGAIANYYNYNEVGVKSIMAGSDIVLVCHDYAHETSVYNGILRAVEAGTISQERLDASVRRIIKAKLLHIM